MSSPFEAGFSCSHWTTFSMTTSKPPWRSTVSCPLIPRALPGRLPFPGPWHARALQNPLLDRFPSQGPQVPPPVGKSGFAGNPGTKRPTVAL